MARWEEALDQLVNLWKFSRHPFGVGFYDSYVGSYQKNGPYIATNTGRTASNGNESGYRNETVPGEIRGDLAKAIAGTCLKADPIYVEDDMFDLAEYAFKSFQEEPLLPSDLLTSNGFVYLPRPLYILDAHKLQTGNRAILWYESQTLGGLGKPGIMLMLFSDVNDKDDWWDKIQEGGNKAPIVEGNTLYLNYITPWAYNEQRDYLVPEKYAGDEDALKEVSATRYVQALFRLMMQTISVKTPETASRPVRRRLEREDWQRSSVLVVRLRRPKADPTDPHSEHPVEWTKRWIVRGHWRNQWYATLNTHRQIYIHPFVKGPENMPLELNKGRVFEWVR